MQKNRIIVAQRLGGQTSQKKTSGINPKLRSKKYSKIRNLISTYYRVQKDILGYKKHIIHGQSNKDLNVKLISRQYCICVHTKSGMLIKSKVKFIAMDQVREWILSDYIELRKYRSTL